MTTAQRWRIEGFAFLAAYIACIPAANWMIQHLGTVCPPGGPCLIPVAPGGLMAPSGVLMAGLALVLRDLVQRRLGVAPALAAIAAVTWQTTSNESRSSPSRTIVPSEESPDGDTDHCAGAPFAKWYPPGARTVTLSVRPTLRDTAVPLTAAISFRYLRGSQQG